MDLYHRFKDRFGTAGVVIAVIALVVALGGTAIAAGGLTTKQKKEVTKIAKKYAGKPGAPGAAGTPGTNGTNGTNGKDGVNGTNGKDGTNGTDGTDGESVTINPYVGSECEEASGEEGAEFTNGSGTAYACNGAGSAGGGFAETLPPGKTETGTWRFEHNGENRFTTISFPIPLSTATAAAVYAFRGFVNRTGFGTTSHCNGSVAEPKAGPGSICIYTSNFETNFPGGNPTELFKLASAEEAGVSTAGALLYWEFPEELEPGAHSSGTFAVTAPEAP